MDPRKLKTDKLNIKRSLQKKETAKIDSPLAKYDSAGNIVCILCRNTIKSSLLWKVHVNSKQHKAKVEAAKVLSTNILHNPSKPALAPLAPSTNNIDGLKKRLSPEKTRTVESHKPRTADEKSSTKSANPNKEDSTIPEQFFDDPISDAKIRNVEYKDTQEEEWEKFQREIKEESTASTAIIAGDQHESTLMRQIEEIDEQMERWEKVIRLEAKIGAIIQKSRTTKEPMDSQSSSDEDDSNSIDEFSNWRAKKF